MVVRLDNDTTSLLLLTSCLASLCLGLMAVMTFRN
jgi:hypothetical protein